MNWHKMGLAKKSGGLRFHDLELFNLALAKKGWRLLSNLDTLVAKKFLGEILSTMDFLGGQFGKKTLICLEKHFEG
jgi:hypothetical protein